MFFIIKTDNKQPLSIIKLKTLVRARSLISMYPMRSSELTLNNYLLENYKLTLKNACLVLLANMQVSVNENNELIMFFRDAKHIQLAQIITYGVDSISGSQILKKALST